MRQSLQKDSSVTYPMQTAQQVAVNTCFLYARMAITVFISLYSTRLILAALGADDFGLFNVISAAIVVFTLFDAAMTSATLRFMAYAQGGQNKEIQKNVFNVSVVLHLIIALLMVISLEAAGFFLLDGVLNINPERLPAARTIFHFMVASTFFTIISVPYDAVINARENMLLVAILGTIEALLKFVIAILITQISSDKLVIYSLLMAFLPAILLLIRVIYCRQKYEEARVDIRKYYSKPLFREMTGFAGWSFLGSASSLIANYGQALVINVFFGTAVNAAQGIAGQVTAQLGVFGETMMRALNPVIAKSEGAGNRALMIQAVMTGSKLSFFLLMLFFIPVLIETSYLFRLWLKNVPAFAVIFCKLLLIRSLIEQLATSLNSSIIAVGNIRGYQLSSSILSSLPLLITYILFASGFSPYALYYVFIIYAALAASLTVYFSHKNYGLDVSLFLRKVVYRCLLCFLLSLILSMLPALSMEEGVARVISVVVCSLVSSLVIIWHLGLTSEERLQSRTVLLQLIKKMAFPVLTTR